MSSRPMTDMWMPPAETFKWRAQDFALAYTMWSVMMVAMMLPSATPLIMVFSRICLTRGIQPHMVYVFALGYLGVWFAFSIGLTLLQWQMHGLAWLDMRMNNQNTVVAGGLLLLAGGYQFSRLKNACLIYCRRPIGFFLNTWKDGVKGAFKMGLKLGLMCLGCCWAEMLIMFAVGVMNLTGMVLITAFILLEKLLPVKPMLISWMGGFFLVGWGFLILLA